MKLLRAATWQSPILHREKPKCSKHFLRFQVVNKKLEHCTHFTDLMRSRLSKKHSLLEWMILIVITTKVRVFRVFVCYANLFFTPLVMKLNLDGRSKSQHLLLFSLEGFVWTCKDDLLNCVSNKTPSQRHNSPRNYVSPFHNSPLSGFGLWWHFLFHTAVLDFNGQKEFHQMDKYSSHIQNKK